MSTGNTAISYDWLDVKVQDTNPDDRLRFYSGGYDLLDAENLGSTDHGDGTFTFQYKVHFSFETYAYTAANIRDVWPKMNAEAQQRYEFLRVRRWHDFQAISPWGPYYVSFDHVELGDTFNSHRYDVDVPITVGLNPDFHNFGGQKLGDIPIEGTNYLWKVKTLEIKDVDTGNIGEYKDKLTSQPSFEEQYIDIGTDEIGDAENTGKSKLQNWIASYNLGAYRISSETYSKQNEITDPGRPGGAIISNTETGEATFTDYIDLRPEVTITRNTVRVRSIDANYHTFTWDIWNQYEGVDVETAKSGDPGVPYVTQKTHVHNKYIYKEYETAIVFECDVNIEDFEKYESLLDKPEFSQGDWIWTSERGGTEALTLVAEPSQSSQIWTNIGNAISDMFSGLFSGLFGGAGSIIALIVITIIVIVIVVIIVYYLKFRQAKETANKVVKIK